MDTNGRESVVSKNMPESIRNPRASVSVVVSEATDKNSSEDGQAHALAQRIGLGLVQSINNYHMSKTIGKGDFAKVKLARHILTGAEVAIKVIEKADLIEGQLANLLREVRIMKNLDHPNIVKLFEVIDTEHTLYLVMEYAVGGEVFDYLVAHGRMREKDARLKFRQILSAMQYCHARNVVHRDLKAENLLLDADMNVKITGFGFSNNFTLGDKLGTFCCSPPYAAPELFQGKKYDGPEVDVWSLGVILYTLVSGSLPFDGTSLKELRERVLRGKYRIPFYMSQECEQLLKRFLVLAPSKRTTLEEVMSDKWINLGMEDQPLKPFTEPKPDYDDERRIRIMESWGFRREDIKRSLENQLYDHITATYLLLYRRKDSLDNVSPPVEEAMMLRPSASAAHLSTSASHGFAPSPSLHSTHHAANGSANAASAAVVAASAAAGANVPAASAGARRQTPPSHPPQQQQQPPQQQQQAQAAAPAQTPQTASSTTNNTAAANPTGGSSSSNSAPASAPLGPVASVPPTGSAAAAAANASVATPSASAGSAAVQKAPVPLGSGPAAHSASTTGTPTSVVPGMARVPLGGVGRRHSVNATGEKVSTTTPAPLVFLTSSASAKGPGRQRTMTETTASSNTDEAGGSPVRENVFDKMRKSISRSFRRPSMQLSGTPPTVAAAAAQAAAYQTGNGAVARQNSSSPPAKPRSLRFSFSRSNTSTRDPDDLINSIKHTLAANAIMYQVVEPYVLRCSAGEVEFEIEVCKLPRLSLNGIRQRRVAGPSVQYKDICTKILDSLDL